MVITAKVEVCHGRGVPRARCATCEACHGRGVPRARCATGEMCHGRGVPRSRCTTVEVCHGRGVPWSDMCHAVCHATTEGCHGRRGAMVRMVPRPRCAMVLGRGVPWPDTWHGRGTRQPRAPPARWCAPRPIGGAGWAAAPDSPPHGAQARLVMPTQVDAVIYARTRAMRMGPGVRSAATTPRAPVAHVVAHPATHLGHTSVTTHPWHLGDTSLKTHLGHLGHTSATPRPGHTLDTSATPRT